MSHDSNIPPDDLPTNEEQVIPLSDEERTEVIEHFESFGCGTYHFDDPDEVACLRALTKYVCENNVPTITDIDHEESAVSIIKRHFGVLEGIG